MNPSCSYTGSSCSWMEASLTLMWHILVLPGSQAIRPHTADLRGNHTKDSALSVQWEGNYQKPVGWLKCKTIWKCF